MKDVKGVLKEAREAIKNKNYEQSLKLCKLILKEDKANYNALVFCGVSLQELGQGQKAVAAFQNAIQANKTNPLAWTGLASYYEKIEGAETKNELIRIYTDLLQIEPNEKKVVEYAEKLSNLSAFGDISKITRTLYSLVKEGTGKNSTELWTCLANLLSKTKNLPEDDGEIVEIYEEVLKAVISNQKTVCTEYYANYLNFLYKNGNRKSELLENAKKMHSLFELDWISLRWICKIFNETYVESSVLIESVENMEQFQDSLRKRENSSATALFTKSILLHESNQLIESMNLLNEVVKILPGMLHAWILLLKCLVKLQLFDDAITASNKINKLLSTANDSRAQLKHTCNQLVIEGFSKSEDEKDAEKVIELYETLSDETKLSSLIHVIRANITLRNYPKARLLISEIKNDEINANLLTAQLLRKERKYKEAVEILNKPVANPDWLIELGGVYWDSDQHEKSLIPYLQSAKLDSNNFKVFLLLGHYYKHFDDADKARRCYEKAFKINGKCAEAGIELSKIYRKLKNWDANFNLLQSLTTSVINKKNSWAWMQLGLHYLEQDEYDKAINSFRFVIRIDEDNLHCWESLADGYLAKGAYTSSLKCYEKASELAPAALYPLLQTATIKQILGEFVEARSSFSRILATNSSYIPALKGIAETCMSQAKECYSTQRYGTARDHAQFSAEKIIAAIEQRNDLGCLWKLLGDSCVFVTRLPEQNCCLSLPEIFVNNENCASKTVLLEKNDLFTLAIRCYCKSLHIFDENVLIWHDLAACYLKQAIYTKSDELLQKAEATARFCTVKNPSDSSHWNLLGNVAFNSNPPNYSRAQHSFIKAVIADNNNAIAWCNLGGLYLILGDFKLANEAFSQAQRSDPNYVNSWVGQALLAENFSSEEAMDLFRHSTQLGMHQQAALGYGHWVCKTLKESPIDAEIYSIHSMHAIPVACDFLTWYTDNNPLDGSAWNMLGLLRERMGLVNTSLDAFRNALGLCDEIYRDLARMNYARLLAKSGKFSESIEMFNKVQSATFNSGSGLALAYFKDQQYKESYEAYDSVLHWLTDEQSFQSDLLAALASMAYMFDGAEAATTLLYQSIQLERPSPFAFFATLSLGLLHGDFNLAELVFSELSRLKDRKDCVKHFTVLCGYLHLLQGRGKKGICEISKVVHRFPDSGACWLVLATVLTRLEQVKGGGSVGAKCAHIAMKLGQGSMDVTQVLCLVSLSSFLAGNWRNCLISAQKAVHCYPNVAEAWAVFASALVVNKKCNGKQKAVLEHAAGLSKNEELTGWLQKTCSDVELCCGGCCTSNVCIETYRDCRVVEDPCLEHYCPEGSFCYTFKPANCKMCEVQAECRFVDDLGSNVEFRGEFPQVSSTYKSTTSTTFCLLSFCAHLLASY